MVDNNIKVSVVIPVFNVSKYIERCADSLFQQSMNDVEYIFVNDCTPDDSIEILNTVINKYPKVKQYIQIVTHSTNRGLAGARNTGLDVAKGEYIYHCDSDDWLDKNALKCMYNAINSNKSDILWCDFYFYQSERSILSKQKNIEIVEECIKSLMSEQLHGGVWNKMYKRSLFIDHNIRFPEGFDMWEDLCTNIYLFYSAKSLSYLPEAFYHYNQENINSLGKGIGEIKLLSIINNTNSVISFLNKNNHLEFNKEINFLKLAAKQTLLFTCEKTNFKKWKNIYPESNKYVLKFKSLPFHLRLLAWFATHDVWILIDLWIFLKLKISRK